MSTTVIAGMRAALEAEMEQDPGVFLMGEDVGIGGSFHLSLGLLERFGADRIRDTPVSEAGFVGLAVGAALAGLRPVVDFQYGDFLLPAADQIIQQACKFSVMSGEQVDVPLVLHAPTGASGRGAQHANSVENLFHAVPGLTLAVPSTAYDAKGAFTSALRAPGPVLVVSHKYLYGSRGRALADGHGVVDDVPTDPYELEIGRAAVRREGSDVTLVGALLMAHRCQEAAERLAEDGIEAEVIDMRWLAPLDIDAVVASVRKTGRLVVVEEGPRLGGWGASVAAGVAEHAVTALDAPIRRLTGWDRPLPAAPHLESQLVPGADAIVAAAREAVQGSSVPVELLVPDLGEGGMELVFLGWLREAGDHVQAGDDVFEVDTAKTTVVVQSFAEGILTDLRVQEGDELERGQVIALLTDSEPSARTDPAPAADPAAQADPAPEVESPPPEPVSAAPGRVAHDGTAGVLASPKAKALAHSLGVEISSLTSQRADGLVTAQDVTAVRDERASHRRARARQATAAVTSRSWREVPHFHIHHDLDVSDLGSPNTLFVLSALVATLVDLPHLNLSRRPGGDVVRRDTVDVGVLVDTDHGLLLPRVVDCGRLDEPALRQRLGGAIERARHGSLAPEDHGPRSASLSNLGRFPVDRFDGVLPVPDPLLLCVGRPASCPRWQDGGWEPVTVLPLSLAVDHRVLDGADAARLIEGLAAWADARRIAR